MSFSFFQHDSMDRYRSLQLLVSMVCSDPINPYSAWFSFPFFQHGGMDPHQSQTRMPTQQSGSRRWYVVTVGCCTGVFTRWYPFSITLSPPLLTSFHRNYTQSLVSSILGNCHKSFKTEALARDYYETSKTDGLVQVRWNPGDDKREFGSLNVAME